MLRKTKMFPTLWKQCGNLSKQDLTPGRTPHPHHKMRWQGCPEHWCLLENFLLYPKGKEGQLQIFFTFLIHWHSLGLTGIGLKHLISNNMLEISVLFVLLTSASYLLLWGWLHKEGRTKAGHLWSLGREPAKNCPPSNEKLFFQTSAWLELENLNFELWFDTWNSFHSTIKDKAFRVNIAGLSNLWTN